MCENLMKNTIAVLCSLLVCLTWYSKTVATLWCWRRGVAGFWSLGPRCSGLQIESTPACAGQTAWSIISGNEHSQYTIQVHVPTKEGWTSNMHRTMEDYVSISMAFPRTIDNTIRQKNGLHWVPTCTQIKRLAQYEIKLGNMQRQCDR